MRIVKFLSAALLTIAALAACKGNSVPGDPLNTKMYTLDNGLKVFLSVNKAEPRIQTYIAVKVGSKNDPSQNTGLAHYFEHLMFKGTEQFGTSDYAAEKPMLDQIEQLFEQYSHTEDPQTRIAIYHQIDSISYEASKIAIPNEYDKLMAVIGASGTNAWTSMDETVYTEDIPSNQIENWARIQADRFKNTVIRGFHTELETIYEEKNMSLTSDNEKLWEALDAGLFPYHPYGRQTVLGTQESLKNPSITNVKKYHDNFYVPNNIAICASGDFDPDEFIAIIEKYFGDWEPNPSIPATEIFEAKPILAPVEKEVYGLEAEMVALGWRTPGPRDLRNAAIGEIAGSIFFNGKAGLCDFDLVQQQKVLAMYGGSSLMADEGEFVAMVYPKQGQTLAEARDLVLAEMEKLRAGDFDEALLKSTINNIKLTQMRQLERNSSRAVQYVNAFINGISWEDACSEMKRYESVTKDDIIAYANEYLKSDNYVVVYKRQGEDTSVQKISAPAITPIVTNRDKQSNFLTEISGIEVKPIEPVFVDFSKDMRVEELADGVQLLYKQNTVNGVTTLEYVFNKGLVRDNTLNLAADYVSYLGTSEMSAEDISSKLYELACSYRVNVEDNQTTIVITGLDENIPEAVKLMEKLFFNAVPDEAILQNLKMDYMKARFDAKSSQSTCFSALSNYGFMGPEYIKAVTMTDEKLSSVSSEELLAKLPELLSCSHDILYYGPKKEDATKTMIASSHFFSDNITKLEYESIEEIQTPENSVLLSQYDAPQIYYYQYTNNGEPYNPENDPAENLYNAYFGGGMNTIVFQEMREARGLAYSASAWHNKPLTKNGYYSFNAFIATQNDKMRQAIEAFAEIINEMPQSEEAFAIAKNAQDSRIRTQRVTGINVLLSYKKCKLLGLSEPTTKAVFEKLQGMTLQDIVDFQTKFVKDRKYEYIILGDIADLDTKYLSTLGPIKTVSSEEIFGY